MWLRATETNIMDGYFFTIKHDYVSEITKITNVLLHQSQHTGRLNEAANISDFTTYALNVHKRCNSVTTATPAINSQVSNTKPATNSTNAPFLTTANNTQPVSAHSMHVTSLPSVIGLYISPLLCHIGWKYKNNLQMLQKAKNSSSK